MSQSQDRNDPIDLGDAERMVRAFLSAAERAEAVGEARLAVHLYAAAFERAEEDALGLFHLALEGAKKACRLACELGERSLAEHAFERVEPYLGPDELRWFSEQLQGLALSRLEEFGLSREALEDVASLISEECGLDGTASVQVRHIELPARSLPDLAPQNGESAFESAFGAGQDDGPDGAFHTEVPLEGPAGPQGAAGASEGRRSSRGQGLADALAPSQERARVTFQRNAPRADDADAPRMTGRPHAAPVRGGDDSPAAAASPARDAQAREGKAPAAGDPASVGAAGGPAAGKGGAGGPLGALGRAADDRDLPSVPAARAVGSPHERLTYATLAGYRSAIAAMRPYGIGVRNDARFLELIERLNRQHGLEGMPPLDTLLFRSAAREDAGRFMLATIGELGLPTLRMAMDENMQGAAVLCVMVQGMSERQRMRVAQRGFDGPGVLVLEDIDLWLVPERDPHVAEDDPNPLAGLTRGARETLELIRSAVENPDVHVLATSSFEGEVDPFFLELLDPLAVIDIELPTDGERSHIWMEIASDHPSMRGIDRAMLVRYSEGMPRFDIYMAAREAVEEAYKRSLIAGEYRPVTAQNIFEKVAAYQPLDSPQYHELEGAVLRDFRRDLDNLDELIDGER
ncbi:ribonucleotide reductase subunit alpha [Eggerthellaceae bacterium zg-997]|nr:ribonucleotide reductase subunit alpha [Eggerthellaceae bacterium zg-997]